ncbi:MAG: hypothetical protein ABIT38_12145, partial [Gemmatimonadaceae bacterium]
TRSTRRICRSMDGMRDDERHEEHDDMNDEMNDDVRQNETNDDALGAREGSDVMFNTWLPNAARDYNRPPASVPRAEMWAQISASLPSSQRTPTLVTPLHAQATSRRSLRAWQMAAAAALLLGTGIAIGQRFSTSDREASAVAASTPAVTSASTPALTLPDSSVPAGTSPTGHVAPDSHRIGSDARNQLALGPRGRDAHNDASYTLATVDHLARAEALLTSFKGAQNDSVDVSMERWAQDLLADTRLLLDSPAATDSRRRRLLEDLELVLAQIVQLRAESSADRLLVRKSIERGEVLTRIRSTIPAGSASGV